VQVHGRHELVLRVWICRVDRLGPFVAAALIDAIQDPSLSQELFVMKTAMQAALAAISLSLATPTFAQDAHHPQDTPSQAAPTQPAPGQGRMGMMGPGGMMGNDMMGTDGMASMMPMMGMMRMMQGPGHVEGRIAFLKAELKITEAQGKPWADFAAALRQAAGRMHGGQAGMMGMRGAASLPQLLEQQEKQLATRLEAVRGVKSALAPLDAVLSDEQRKTLAQLHPMFMGMM
jgi:hypothetical protein